MQNDFSDEKKRAICFLVVSLYKGDASRAAKALSIPKDIVTEIYEGGLQKANSDLDRVLDSKRLEINARIEAERADEEERRNGKVNLRKLKNDALKKLEETISRCDDPSKIATSIKVIDDLSEKSSTEASGGNSVYEFIKNSRKR